MKFWRVINFNVPIPAFCIVILISAFVVILIKKKEVQPPQQKQLTNIDSKLLLDSITIQRLRYEKDSIKFVDSLYIQHLRTLSKRQLQGEFEAKFSR